MRGLTIVLIEASAPRFRGALTLAAANAAIGARARVFCQGEAVALLRRPIASDDDGRHEAAGLPTLDAMVEEALALGVVLRACQSGLYLAGIDAAALDPRIAVSGPLAILHSLGKDRLVLG